MVEPMEATGRMQSEQLFEVALGVTSPWYVRESRFNAEARNLTIQVDFHAGSRFGHPDAPGEHPVHDTQTKRYRHLNFFQHECFLEVRVPRVKLPDGSVRLIEPPWAGKLSGFTLLFEALVLCLCREMPFAAVARLVGESWHRVAAIAERYVELALAQADYSAVRELAIDETSKARGHDYVTIAADAERRARERAAAEEAAREQVAEAARRVQAKVEARRAAAQRPRLLPKTHPFEPDMIALPGETSADTISAIIADEAAIGIINHKTTAARLIPVPGAVPGDWVDWGGLLGRAPVIEVRDRATVGVIQRAGHMPPPLRALGARTRRVLCRHSRHHRRRAAYERRGFRRRDLGPGLGHRRTHRCRRRGQALLMGGTFQSSTRTDTTLETPGSSMVTP